MYNSNLYSSRDDGYEECGLRWVTAYMAALGAGMDNEAASSAANESVPGCTIAQVEAAKAQLRLTPRSQDGFENLNYLSPPMVVDYTDITATIPIW